MYRKPAKPYKHNIAEKKNIFQISISETAIIQNEERIP
jgi:hypothetical protein